MELALGAAVHIPHYEIDATPLRLAHFMAQLAHESAGFLYMEEIASGAAYEGRKDLGNTQPGDGRRFKGRGPIQLTGRANYRWYGQLIGIDLERHPEIAAIPSIGMLTACLYWHDHRLNEIADVDDVERITRKINGGLNGFADRKAKLAVMKDLLR
jgi:putative chitinase